MFPPTIRLQLKSKLGVFGMLTCTSASLALFVVCTGELYVIVEYCPFGNMRNYLLKHKDSFKDTMEDYRDPVVEKRREATRDSTQPYYMNKAEPYSGSHLVGPALTTKNLVCFAFQVARGMEYLASRKVCIG